MQFSASCRCSSYCFNKIKVYISAMSHEVAHEVISIASDQWYLGRYSIYVSILYIDTRPQYSMRLC